MKRAIGILLLMLVAGVAQARGGAGHGGGHGGGGRAAAPSARPGMSAGFARFTTGAPTQFTTGPQAVRYGVGYRPGPGYRARPTPIPPPPAHFRPPVVVGGGTVVVTAPYWYPGYAYPYPYPYVAPEGPPTPRCRAIRMRRRTRTHRRTRMHRPIRTRRATPSGTTTGTTVRIPRRTTRTYPPARRRGCRSSPSRRAARATSESVCHPRAARGCLARRARATMRREGAPWPTRASPGTPVSG
jgi:hypothetical protein